MRSTCGGFNGFLGIGNLRMLFHYRFFLFLETFVGQLGNLYDSSAPGLGGFSRIL